MHRVMMRLARLMAVLGGATLILLVLLVCVSVAGRSLNTLMHGPLGTMAPGFSAWALGLGIGPIEGDFELVEAGIAFAVFAFLPLCHLTSGHATVDLFTTRLPVQVSRVLRMGIEIVFASVLILIAVQLLEGMLSKRRFGETTFLLQFPVWWSYAASLVAAGVGVLVGCYLAGVRIAEVVAGRPLIPDAPDPHK